MHLERVEPGACAGRLHRSRAHRRPALSALAIITFLYAWNDLFWPLIALTSTKVDTVQLGLTTFQGQHRTEWSAVMAGNVLSTAPVLIVFLIGQRRFVQALTGAVKG